MAVLFPILGIVALLWIIIGSIVGVVFLVLFFKSKEKEAKKQYLLRALICLLGGWVMMVVNFLLYWVSQIIGYML